MDEPWLKHDPTGVPAVLPADAYPSLTALLEESFERFRDRSAYRFMGRSLGFGEVDQASRAFAAWLQAQGIGRGDRVAVMLPNVPQYPVAVCAVLRAGGVVVNIDPHEAPADLEQQLKDCGARAMVVLESFCAALEPVLERVPVRHVVVASVGDMLGLVQRSVVKHLLRPAHSRVPAWRLPQAVRFHRVLAQGRRLAWTPPALAPDDIAVLQYTGGTTGVRKGAVLLHRNLVANVLQCEAWCRPALARLPEGRQVTMVCALPLHHIFAFGANMLLGLRVGGCNLLVPDARDIGAMLRTLQSEPFHVLPATDSLFQALLRHPGFDTVNWRSLLVSVAGGMAVQRATAELWMQRTGNPICEGYGLTEASPSVCCNPVDTPQWNGSVGLPLPGTEVRLLDDEGRPVPAGSPGEIAVRGPQVMAGYWHRPDDTARVMTPEGFLRTGDIGTIDEQGRLRVVERKKDMILVSGFHVFPHEIETVLGRMPGVREAAAVGVPDARAGEAVKVVVVRNDPAVREADVRAWCEANLTGYKRPKWVEFRSELPRTPVGKVLRRELRA
jgi:long-chain acyl-CoA synthetase